MPHLQDDKRIVTPPPKRRRRLATRLPKHWRADQLKKTFTAPEKKLSAAWFGAFLLTLVIHGFIFYSIPASWVMPQKAPKKPEIQVEIAPADEEQFVETNPTAPTEEPPKKTPFFSSQAQKAAQEKPLENAQDDRPYQKEGDPFAHKVVPGSVEMMENTPPEPQTPEKEAEENKSVETPPDVKTQPTDKGTLPSNEQTPQVETSKRPAPRQRPQVAMNSVSGPLRSNTGGTQNIGMQAVDARFTQYGEYLQKMAEAISTQWVLLCKEAYKSLPDSGTYVLISFIINPKGEIIQMNLESTNASQAAILLAKDGIASRAPFGEWTPDMIKTLGNAQTLKMKFLYL